MHIDVNKDMLRTLLMMGAVVEARDPYTGGHLWRVSQYAKRLATRLGLSNDEILQLAIGGYLHDLGKVGVPDQILRKPGSLTDDEFAVIKTHPEVGAEIIEEHPLSAVAHDAIRHHHERIDAKGYPDALPAGKLPISARVIAIADAFDAMTSTRAYRHGLDKNIAVERLLQGRGSQFDAVLVSQFVTMVHAGELDEVLLHSDENLPLVSCDMCGPIIAVNRDHKDGDIIHCQSCGTEYRLHRMADTFAVEATGRKANQTQLRPRADRYPIDELVSQMPGVLKL